MVKLDCEPPTKKKGMVFFSFCQFWLFPLNEFCAPLLFGAFTKKTSRVRHGEAVTMMPNNLEKPRLGGKLMRRARVDVCSTLSTQPLIFHCCIWNTVKTKSITCTALREDGLSYPSPYACLWYACTELNENKHINKGQTQFIFAFFNIPMHMELCTLIALNAS